MRVLVVGVNGFLGSNLIKTCLTQGWQVSGIYHKQKNNIPKGVTVFAVDQLELITQQFDVVFLVAAYIPKNEDPFHMRQLIECNILLPLRISHKFKKTKIIYTSSTSVYGKPSGVISENSFFNNPNSYGVSKIIGEHIIRLHSNYQIIRFSSIYGSGMNQNTFIPRILRQAKKVQQITILGNGTRKQNYLYIDDAIGYCLAAIGKEKSGIYLGVDSRSYSNLEVAKIIKLKIRGCKIRKAGIDNSASFVYNNTKTVKQLGFAPKIKLKEGLESLLGND